MSGPTFFYLISAAIANIFEKKDAGKRFGAILFIKNWNFQNTLFCEGETWSVGASCLKNHAGPVRTIPCKGRGLPLSGPGKKM